MKIPANKEQFNEQGAGRMTHSTYEVLGFQLQEQPPIYVAAVEGQWLLERSSPVWRIENPELGFQRIVRESRAREIALAVLDQHRMFPNAIVLATDESEFELVDGSARIPNDTRFLVVDGQHRLWSQKYSEFQALYACVIHTGLTEIEMARLFLEINDTQKRVPSSLRWDLVRLVRPDDDPAGIAAAEMVFLLATEEGNPLFQRIDLTGEQSEIYLKQGSIAPELKRLFSRRSPLYDFSFELQFDVIKQYFAAIREIDREHWGEKESYLFKARVLRALLRLLTDIIRAQPDARTFHSFLPLLQRIDIGTLKPELIRAAQASAGIKAIYDTIRLQVFGEQTDE